MVLVAEEPANFMATKDAIKSHISQIASETVGFAQLVSQVILLLKWMLCLSISIRVDMMRSFRAKSYGSEIFIND
ncbi:hypothetical protein E3N88_23373 [Mikania micrantha]|uniref:Uncharacterized protein n=1 Tax=Mikania micrantha TaxID=192012 RepID=A0A5N6ND57_9ASTR|nr:hypothetical protein E3N88_23373 [Mikania micrantha]